ncbi:hypothetical protein RUM4293_03936 [Ruegeria atlantica]|uniref:Uncharacterized protein n=1 Tax=Ruegeria atlantica TaxID=81569 RepID=A0A0P1EQY5_9RHOB|nr:hypothetical protein RUM4293_03936 [Ruegeria atlantica]
MEKTAPIPMRMGAYKRISGKWQRDSIASTQRIELRQFLTVDQLDIVQGQPFGTQQLGDVLSVDHDAGQVFVFSV